MIELLLLNNIAVLSVGIVIGVLSVQLTDEELSSLPKSLKKLLNSLGGLFLLSFRKFDALVGKLLKKLLLRLRRSTRPSKASDALVKASRAKSRAVRNGLKDAKAGRLKSKGSFSKNKKRGSK